MDLRRLRPAEWILGVAALLLLVALFLPWYQDATGRRATAWEAFTVVDVLLALAAAMGLAAVLLQGTQRSPALPVVASVAATWVAIVAVVLVVIKLVDPPGRYAETCYGIWVALVAAAALVGGGWWAMRDDDKPGLGVRGSHLESSG
ncbi:MAG TPA: hypothetical protein VHR88_00025 [Solirubrobacteraceae bacterium]|nr:hypothetical protein [Solirubrobacteraceae bacterium]